MPTLRTQLSQGRTVVGLAACVMRSVEIVTVTRACGFDFLLIDMEHGPISVGEAATMSVAAHEGGLPALVRVSGPTSPDLARVLDCGAQGVVVPHVDSVEQARHIAALCRFPPVGRRSIPSPLARLDFLNLPIKEAMETVERDTFVIAMIESKAGVKAAAEIAAVPGIDGIMIGSNDLAADMGLVGEVEHEDVRRAFASVAEATLKQKKVFGVIGLPEVLLQSHGRDLGASLFVATNDINLLVDGGMATLGRVRPLAIF